MTQQIINIGETPNDGTGDSNRAAFNKANHNFTELYNPATATLPASSRAEFDEACTDADFLYVGDITQPPPQPTTKAEFNTALTDGNFLFAGDVTLPPPLTNKSQFNAACTDGDFLYVDDVPVQGFAVFEYTFDTGVAEPVGSANVRFNTSSYEPVTKVWVHDISAANRNVGNFFTLVEFGMRLYFQDKDDANRFVTFNVIGTPIDKGAYTEFPVSFRSKGSAPITAGRILMNIAGAGGTQGGASGVYTVATLPLAPAAGKGARAFVSDATVTTFASTVAGGGANNVPVFSDGAVWKIG